MAAEGWISPFIKLPCEETIKILMQILDLSSGASLKSMTNTRLFYKSPILWTKAHLKNNTTPTRKLKIYLGQSNVTKGDYKPDISGRYLEANSLFLYTTLDHSYGSIVLCYKG